MNRLIDIVAESIKLGRRLFGGQVESSAGIRLQRVCRIRNLRRAFRRASTNNGADTAGADGLTFADVADSEDEWLADLSQQLKNGAWQPGPIRHVQVPKKAGSKEHRTLAILTIADRVVHTAVKQILEPVLELDFSPNSFGFRPKRSVAMAVNSAVDFIHTHGSRTALRLDVADCFDTLSHREMRSLLRSRIPDRQLRNLLDTLLAGCASSRSWTGAQRGLAQGSSLSPLLCNLCLDSLDRVCEQHLVQKAGLSLRYADDLLVLLPSGREATGVLEIIERCLNQQGQSLSASKSQICDLREGVNWLGQTIAPVSRGGKGRIQFARFIPEGKCEDMVTQIHEIACMFRDPERVRKELEQKVMHWKNAYSGTRNCADVFRVLDSELQRTSQKLGIRLKVGLPVPGAKRLGDVRWTSVPIRSRA